MKEIMKRAWQITKEAMKNFGGKAYEYLAEALRMAWAEHKAPRDITERIEELEALGFKRWQKNGMDRLYVDARRIGLEVGYYKTGNISWSQFDGCSISHAEAGRMLSTKTYIDLVKREIVSGNYTLACKVADICGVAHKGWQPRFAF